MIEGVLITPLKQTHDAHGSDYCMLRKDARSYNGFGELYFSLINPGVVKGWKRHREMIMNLAVPAGKLKIVLIDQRSGSVTKGAVMEVLLGQEQGIYNLVTVPAMVWSGSKCLSDTPAIMANCASIKHDSSEVEDLALDDPKISYKW